MGIDEKLVDEIVCRILAVASPRRIILFGSASTGAMTRDSDIDLLIVVDSPASSIFSEAGTLCGKRKIPAAAKAFLSRIYGSDLISSSS